MTGDIGTTALTTAQLASHTHTLLLRGGPSGSGRLQSSQGRFDYYASGSAGSGTAHNHATGTLAGTLTGTVAVSSTITGTAALTNALTGAVTAAGTNTFSPYVVVNYIIKH